MSQGIGRHRTASEKSGPHPLRAVVSRCSRRLAMIAAAAAFFVCLPLGACAQATQQDPLHTASRQELEIVKVVLAQERAWNAGDLAAYAKTFKDSPDTLFIGHQISRGFAEIVAEYKHDYPNPASMGTLGFSELEVHPLSDTFAVCLGKYHIDRTKKEGGPADGLFSLVFEKTADGWKIVVDHAT